MAQMSLMQKFVIKRQIISVLIITVCLFLSLNSEEVCAKLFSFPSSRLVKLHTNALLSYWNVTFWLVETIARGQFLQYDWLWIDDAKHARRLGLCVAVLIFTTSGHKYFWFFFLFVVTDKIVALNFIFILILIGSGAQYIHYFVHSVYFLFLKWMPGGIQKTLRSWKS